MLVRDGESRPPRWLWVLADPRLGVFVVVGPAIASAYLLAKGRLSVGLTLLAVWVLAFAALAATAGHHGYARPWILLTGGILVFAVSLAVFTWLPTP